MSNIENSQINRKGTDHLKNVPDHDKRFGIYKIFQPKILQVCTNRYLVLVTLSLGSMFLQAITNGFPSVSWRTLEIKFHLNSAQTGWLSSCYEIANTALSVIIIHFLQEVHKPIWIGIGLFVTGIGGIIYCLPHFVSDPYIFNDLDIFTSCQGSSSFNKKTLYIFLLAFGQLLAGAGSVTNNVFSLTYIDENIKRKQVPMYHTFYLIIGIVGVTIGLIGGGLLLLVSTDFHRPHSEMVTEFITINNQTVANPFWVGAWWLGPLICSCCLIFLSFIISCLPRRFGKEIHFTDGDKWVSFFGSLKKIAKNKIWWMVVIATSADAWLIQCFAAFVVKQGAMTFMIESSKMAWVAGIVLILGTLVGYLISGLVLHRWKDDDKQKYIKMGVYCLIGPVISFAATFAFLVGCDNYAIQWMVYGGP